MSEVDDLELAERSCGGDREAWEQLAARSAPRLAAYLGARLRRPEVVEMLVAEAIYAAWRKIGDLEDPADFAAWFRRIGANLALRWHSKHKHEKLVGDFPVARCAGDVELAGEMQRIETALAKLDEADRMALEQRFRGGLVDEALAEALHKPLPAADEAVERALERLAVRLDDGESTAG